MENSICQPQTSLENFVLPIIKCQLDRRQFGIITPDLYLFQQASLQDDSWGVFCKDVWDYERKVYKTRVIFCCRHGLNFVSPGAICNGDLLVLVHRLLEDVVDESSLLAAHAW